MNNPPYTTIDYSSGEKRFRAIEDGVHESTQSWREVPPGLKQHGFTCLAKLAVGDEALVFWLALLEVFPSTRTERCWMHKTGNVLNYLQKSDQAKSKQGLHEIWMAETRAKAQRAFDKWLERYNDKYPKATPPAWCVTVTNYSRSTTSPPRTGSTFERPTSANRPSPRSAIEAYELRAATPDKPCCRCSTRWAPARRNPGAGSAASATSPSSSRPFSSTSALNSSRTAEPPHEQPTVHQN